MYEDARSGLGRLLNGELDPALFGLLVKAVAALLTLIVTYFIAKLVARWITNTLRRRVDDTLGKFAGKLAFYSIFTVAGLAVLQTVGLSITSFAAVLAAAGFAIGLAFQGTLSNFASGVLLLVFRPFKVGDFVSAAGVAGTIDEIDLFTTVMDTPDNRRLIIPNSSIAGTTIENITFHQHRRVEVVVGVSYAADLEHTRDVLEASVESLREHLIEGEGRGYQILCTDLNASSVDWTIRFWTRASNFFLVKEALIVSLKKHLDANEIEIPFPQMQLHIAPEQASKRFDSAHAALQMPQMNPAADHERGERVRPRARGDQPPGEQ